MKNYNLKFDDQAMVVDFPKRLELLQKKFLTEQSARIKAETLFKKITHEIAEAKRKLSVLNETIEEKVQERTCQLEREWQSALELAEQDKLTKLANRHRYNVDIEQAVSLARESHINFALVLIDLDGFKKINDTFGHQSGDAVLETVAARIQKTVRKYDFCARLGGDEFAIVLYDADDEPAIMEICNRLLKTIKEPISFGGRALTCGASIGIAFCPEHATDSESLQGKADMALYEAKTNGKGTVLKFEENMAAVLTSRKELGIELEKTLKNSKIDIWYQPICCMKTGSVKGLEALLRWEHPRRGLVGALEILSVAHEYNLMPTLTRQIIKEALINAKEFLNKKTSNWVSINLTADDLSDVELPEYIIQCCDQYKINPKQVKFEITEHTLVSDTIATGRVMKYLSEAGFAFSIDDFGTGYSNLLTLSRLPFNTLKIDRSFVIDMFITDESMTIIKTMIDLAHALGLETISEGVETADQSEALQSLGCNYVQGYLIGRPYPSIDKMKLAMV